MRAKLPPVDSIDAYIARLPPDVRQIMTKLRALIHEVAPGVTEKISYQIPAFMLRTMLVYLGAFKHHISLFPPVRDPSLLKRVARYANDKGNLSFPLSEPMPYELIRQVVRTRLDEYRRDESLRVQKVVKVKKTPAVAKAKPARTVAKPAGKAAKAAKFSRSAKRR